MRRPMLRRCHLTIWALVMMLMVSLPAVRVSAAADIASFKLANGLEVVVVPDHRLPVVTHMVWYRVGGADEPRGRSGLAHLLEHLMFKATDRLKSGEFSRIITRLGGNDNAITTQDTTYYFQRVSKDRLRRVMELEAGRMTGLRIDEKEVEVERMVVLEERRGSVEGDPVSVLSEQMLATLYQNHPYGTPVLGWPHELPTLTKADALPFYKRFYSPNNAILVVAGDVTADEVRTLAEATYGALPSGPPLPERARPAEPPARAARRVVLEDARAAGPTFVRFYLTPSAASAVDREAEALEVLARVLGQGDNSRLSTALVLEGQVALAAAAQYTGNARDSGRLSVFALPAPGVAIGDLEQRLNKVVDDLRVNGITADELARATGAIEANRLFESDSQQERARGLGEALTVGRSLAHIQAAPQRLRALTTADVAAAAARYLDPRRSVTGILLPESRATTATGSGRP